MKIIRNCADIINWDYEISLLSDGHRLVYNDQSFNKNLPQFAKMDKIWQDAGYQYDTESIEWINYFPRKELIDQFSVIVDAKPWMVWFSKIRPGKMAPWHEDVHSKINEVLSLGTPVRFTCYIQDPHVGHVSIVENYCVYMPKKGDIYQWPSHDAWHCGMNGGLVDKYMFNFWGYR
jgi:hypothetical protein